MQSTARLLKKSPSSSRWLQRQSQDPYVRLRTSATNDETYRSRSAFKLVSLFEKHPSLLGRGKIVADLGAAPGGWSQVAAYRGAKVIAVDLNHMDPIEGVDFVQGDFLQEEIRRQVEVLSAGRKVDTVLSDMMASMTGVRDRDVQASLDLVAAATMFGIQTLKVGSKEDEAEVEVGKSRPTYSGGNMV
jgi:23S rRNA (uridine2552-2'-O)-methyltransferase